MKISLLTCTGARPEAMKLCEEWIRRQTVRPDEIIVVDDGREEPEIYSGARILRPVPRWSEGENTQIRNLRLGMARCTGDVIFFIEDDDYYSPCYIEKMLEILNTGRKPYQAVGMAKRRYYHLPTQQYYRYHNVGFTSLAQTAISRKVLNEIALPLVSTYEGVKYDVRLWEEIGKKMKKEMRIADTNSYVVGIKGMPGRKGIGVGHSPTSGWFKDSKLTVFKEWLGEDWKYYEEFLK